MRCSAESGICFFSVRVRCERSEAISVRRATQRATSGLIDGIVRGIFFLGERRDVHGRRQHKRLRYLTTILPPRDTISHQQQQQGRGGGGRLQIEDKEVDGGNLVSSLFLMTSKQRTQNNVSHQLAALHDHPSSSSSKHPHTVHCV